MPKIIENLREQLLAEAKRQISQYGYADTTIRSVAGACGVGVGTVYNYFKSKETLIAAFVLEDWKVYLNRMAQLPTDDPKALFRGIYEALHSFSEENKALFSDNDAAKLVSAGVSSRHKMLREQIAAFLLPVCQSNGLENPTFTAEFLGESLINWSVDGREFDEVYPLLEKVIKN